MSDQGENCAESSPLRTGRSAGPAADAARQHAHRRRRGRSGERRRSVLALMTVMNYNKCAISVMNLVNVRILRTLTKATSEVTVSFVLYLE